MSNQSSMMPGQLAPYSQEAEEAVLGAVMVNPEAFLGVASFLRTEDFYILRHGYIWDALLHISERNDQIDFVTVVDELRAVNHLNDIGGPGYLLHLVNSTPTSVHAEVYGHLVERAGVRRRLLTAADAIKALAMDEQLSIEKVTSDSESKLFTVTERNLRRELIPMRDAINTYFERMEHLIQHPDEPLGLPTGFRDLDELLGGLQRSDLLIFAGRPGMGKCVAEGTLIHTDSGLVPIEALKPKGIVGVLDDEGGTFYPLEIGVQSPDGLKQTSHFYDSGVKPTLRIQTRAGYSLTGTLVHPLLTQVRSGQNRWTQLSHLCVGDLIRVQNGSQEFYWDEITQIEPSGMKHCYDLCVPDGHAFVSDGIVSHNTSFLLSVALNAAKLGARILIFTMEMGHEQLVQRFVSMETGINTQKLRTGQLLQQEWERFVAASGRLGNLHITIDDTPAMTPIQMRTKCRRMAHEFGLDLVIVDYMQLMSAGTGYENNRVQEISYISRSLKELARELNVPLFSAAQLSRAVEQRQDKRPQLSDLRESGCLAGDTPVYLPDSGNYVPVRELEGKSGFNVLALNPATWKLESAEVSSAFCTGIKPVYKLTTGLGRTIRATANHKFMTIGGWKRLDELTLDDCIALPRALTSSIEQTMSNAELALLGHLIGDGCTLPKHAIQYTTKETEIGEIVAQLANEVFGDTVRPRIQQEKGHNWYQVFLATTQHLTHGVHNPVRVWLENLNVFGLRSHEKYVPEKVFAQPNEAIAVFLRHLWTTDGCIGVKPTANNSHYPVIYYASSSEKLARDVQSLLLRFEINARITRIPQKGKGRDQYHVTVTGKPDFERFVQSIGAVGTLRKERLAVIADYTESHVGNTNRDIIPRNIWRMHAVPAMQQAQVTTREMQAQLGNNYCGTGLYKQNVSRERGARLAEVVQSSEIAALSTSDVYWDEIASIEPDGETEVYDLTVPSLSNFVAGNIIVHNSIEQDADIVIFLYRDVVYNEATEFPARADLITAKHRNGPTGTISLHFEKSLTKFSDARTQTIDLSAL